jgi:hypothetical protein
MHTKNHINFLDTPYFENPPESLGTVRENMKLKRMLKRAVEREMAPQNLIDSIRDRIRG